MSEGHETLTSKRNRLRRWATYASVALSSFLILAKLIAYILTDSVAVLSSLLDSTIDLVASIVTAYGVASALRPPDSDHRFGHGKAEPLAALAQSAFIVGSSILLSYEAIQRIYKPHVIQHENIGYVVMSLTIVLTIALVEFQYFVVRRTSSIAINADHLHYLGDLFVNIMVVVSLMLYQWTGLTWFDPVFALVIAVVLVAGATRIARQALDVLMDRELPAADRERIKAIVQSHPMVKGLHDLRTRSDSDRVFMELHIEMDPGMLLREVHAVGESITTELEKQFPNADVTIHNDPEGLEEDRLDARIAIREGGIKS